MTLRLVGCSHHDSSVAVRERLAFSPAEVAEALQRLAQQFPGLEAVLLSTCNRVELYVAGDAGEVPASEQLIAFLAEFHELDPLSVSDSMFCCDDQQAVQHLFLVAASLDSMVVGESQILSQVKQAFTVASDQHTTGTFTHHLFETAYRVAKKVANETEINRRRISIPSIAVADYAKRLFETFQDKHVLLIGAGDMGEETLRYLRDEGAEDIVVLNRSRERGSALAQRLQASSDDWDQLDTRLAWADLIVSTTSSREPIVSAERFQATYQQRSQSLLFVLDLAVPRDFDPQVAQFANVYLYCIDDLQSICDKNRQAREKELPSAQRIVSEETRRFMAERNHRATAPTILRLRQQADQIKDVELTRLLNKLGTIDDQSRGEIEQAFDRLVNKLLHPPLESLRDEAKKGSHHSLLAALRHLFQISD
jgi:glutamyl-tRNA reductase